MVLAFDNRAAHKHAEPGRAEASGLHLPQIPALTGLRFLAAAFILVEHTADWLAQFSNSNIRQYFIFLGIYGMPLFFVLSGFVIHYNYRKLFRSRSIARATCEFAAARFARLFPLYFFLLLVAICADNLASKVRGDAWLLVHILAYYITLTQSWWYTVIDNRLIINWLFGLSWSISTEMYFYVAFIVVVSVILLIRRPGTAVAVTAGYAIFGLGLFILSRYYLAPILVYAKHLVPNYIPPDDFADSFYRWLFYFSPYARVFEFLMGCFTAHAFILVRERPVGSVEQRCADASLIAALLYLTMCGLLNLDVLQIGFVNAYVQHLALNFLCAPAIAVIMFHVARYKSLLNRMLSLPLLILLGDTSYSIYLIHSFTLRLFNRAPAPLNLAWGLETLLRVACGIGLTLVTAYATYRLIEMPSRAWLRRKLGAFIATAFGDGSIPQPGV